MTTFNELSLGVTFHKKDEAIHALSLLTPSERDRIGLYARQLSAKTAANEYITYSFEHLWDRIRKGLLLLGGNLQLNDPNVWKKYDNNYYEIRPLGRPVKLALDLEYNKKLNPDADFDRMCHLAIGYICRRMKKDYPHINISYGDFQCYEASDESKASRHYVLNANTVIFESTKGTCRPFMKRVIRDIEEDHKEGNDEAEELFVTREVGKKNKKEQRCHVVDMSIYGKDGLFRLLYNTKKGSPRILLPQDADLEFTLDADEEYLYDAFEHSLVCATAEQVRIAKEGGFYLENIEMEEELSFKNFNLRESMDLEPKNKTQESLSLGVSEQEYQTLKTVLNKLDPKIGAFEATFLWRENLRTGFPEKNFRVKLLDYYCPILGDNHSTKKHTLIYIDPEGNTNIHCFSSNCQKKKEMEKESGKRKHSSNWIEALERDVLFGGDSVIDGTQTFAPEKKSLAHPFNPVRLDLLQKMQDSSTSSQEMPSSPAEPLFFNNNSLDVQPTMPKKKPKLSKPKKRQLFNWQKTVDQMPRNFVLRQGEEWQDKFDAHVTPLMNRCLAYVIAGKCYIHFASDLYEDEKYILLKPAELYQHCKKINITFIYPPDDKGKVKKLTKSVDWFWTQSEIRKEYSAIVFDTNPQSYGNDKIYNLFEGWDWELLPEDEDVDMRLIQPLLDHFKNIIANGNQEAYDRIMDMIQNAIREPHNKYGVAIVLLSEDQGTGKSIILTELLGQIFGKYFAVTNNINDLHADFNSLFTNKIWITIEEVKSGGGYQNDQKTKDLITGKKQVCKKKYMDAYNLQNCARYSFLTNNRDAIKLEDSNRRYFCVEVSNKMVGNQVYFEKLAEVVYNPVAIRHFITYLWRDWTPVTEFNPRVVPDTDWSKELKEISKRGLEGWLSNVCTNAMSEESAPFVFYHKDHEALCSIPEEKVIEQPIEPGEKPKYTKVVVAKPLEYAEPGTPEEVQSYKLEVCWDVVRAMLRSYLNKWENDTLSDDRIAKKLSKILGKPSTPRRVGPSIKRFVELPAPSILKKKLNLK
jgi:hypothetical protein